MNPDAASDGGPAARPTFRDLDLDREVGSVPTEATSSPMTWAGVGVVFASALLALFNGGCLSFTAMGQNSRGVQLASQGQYPSALNQFQRAAEVDPRNADAHYNIARVYHLMGVQAGNRQMLEQAEHGYNMALHYDGEHADTHRSLAVLLIETERSDRAFALLKNWAARNPRSADARVELARLYYEFGDKSSSRYHLAEAVQAQPHNARVARALGALYEEEGRPYEALANYQRSYQLNSFQSDLPTRIASLQQATGTRMGSGVISNTGPRWASSATGYAPRYRVPTEAADGSSTESVAETPNPVSGDLWRAAPNPVGPVTGSGVSTTTPAPNSPPASSPFDVFGR